MKAFLKLISGRKPFLALFLLEIQALSGYAWLSLVHLPSGWRGTVLSLFLFAVPTLLTGAVLALVLGRSVRGMAGRTGKEPSRLAASFVLCLSPLVLLDLVFLQFVVFLRDIRSVLFPVSVLGSIYLLAIFFLRSRESRPGALLSRLERAIGEVQARPGKTARTLIIISFLAYAFLASGLVFPPQPFTGDEPHYLLITKSLLADGDIDVFNNYQNEDYLAFYPGPLESHAFQGKKGPGHTYSRHLPGTSVLILPSYIAGELAGKILAADPEKDGLRRGLLVFAVRLMMCLLTALLGAALFLLALKLTGRAGPSLAAWGIFGLTSPFIFYSQLVYPEIPAALITILVFGRIILGKETRTSSLMLAGAGIALLPWFGIKYSLISAVLFLLCLPTAMKGGPRRWARAWTLTLFPAFSAAAYLLFLWVLYGRLSPSSVYTGVLPAVNYTGGTIHYDSSIFETLRFAVGHLFDQRMGIFPYAPVYVLFFAGAFRLLKKRKNAALSLLALLGSYWLFCSFTHLWGGHCPPGRLLLPIMWVIALFMAAALTGEFGRTGRSILTGTIGLSILTALAGLRDPWLLYHDNPYTVLTGPGTSSRLLTSLSNSLVDLTALVPELVSPAKINGPVLAGWLLAAALVTFIFVKRRNRAPNAQGKIPLAVHGAIVLVLSILVVGYAFSNIRLASSSSAGGDGVEIFFQDGNTYGMEEGGFWTKASLETTVLIRSSRPLAQIEMGLSSPVPGRTTVQAGMKERTAVRLKKDPSASVMEFRSPVGFRWRAGYFYSLQVRDSAGFVPHELDRNVPDARRLGVFVKLSVRN